MKCPRCLGKGFVDWEDIRRLNKQLKWVPAPCAYCNGEGKVDKEMLSKVAVDCTYLTIDLPESEIEQIKNGEEEAIEKGKQRELFIENLIQFAEKHLQNQNLDAESIANLYMETEDETAPFSVDKESLIKYIQGIIEFKRSNFN
ncbi:hypothetical protein [Flavobacterium endoglycinae]|nr:hypothetical protein [Flavobacterium endoglycinae]